MKNNIITINNVTFEVTEDIAKSILTICTAMGKKVTTKAETKAETPKSPKPASPKTVKGKKVLKVDKYGNQWVAEYDAAKEATKKAEMITAGTYDPKNRSKVYKELGWIL